MVVLSFSPIYRDPRVLRQVTLLSEFAEVITCGYGPTPQGVTAHVEVPDALKSWRRNRLRAALLIGARRWHRLYFGSDRIRFVREAFPPGSVDVVVANDELAVPVALALRPRGGVHADLHEYSPRRSDDRAVWRLTVAPFMRWACRAVRRADSVTTVAPGIAQEYEREFGFSADVVPNAARHRADLAPTAPGTPLRLVHIGIAGRDRKLEVMIDAVAQVEAQVPGSVTLDIIVAPGQADYIEELVRRAADLAPAAVRVLPPVPFDQMVTTLAAYDVGVFVCPPTTFNLEHALPNKFFEYIQARLAVVVGPSPEMAPLVEKYGVGIVADGFDAAATARAIAALSADDVARYKAASDKHAAELSADNLSTPWVDSVMALVQKADR